MITENDYLNIITEKGIYPNKKNLKLHLTNIFSKIDFKNKKVLDIGGGSGVHSSYAAVRGAAKVDCLEPEFDGSHEGMKENFEELQRIIGATNVELHSVTFQDYETKISDYDLILTYNVVNHLNEEACQTLQSSQDSRDKFVRMFMKCSSMLKQGGMMLVADCGRRNFFGDLGIYNPFANDIDWKIHQEPKFWLNLMEKAGFKRLNIHWSTFNSLGRLGKFLFGNRLFSYLTFSHFYFWTIKR